MEINKVIDDVATELAEASNKFRPFQSPHEGLAIILEEYEELKAEVFKSFNVREKLAMRDEARHLAAMAMRFMVDLT